MRSKADRSSWHAGQAPADAARPRLSLVPAPEAALAPPPHDGWRVDRLLDRVIAGSSLLPVDPVLDVRAFPWTQQLRDDWRAIREEAHAALPAGGGTTTLAIEPVAARCPITAQALAAIPGLERAEFARLAGGDRIAPRRGRTKALITCHLGLSVPRDGDARMRLCDRTVRWAEGETLVFDDTCLHAAWNDAGAARLVLSLSFRRPLRQPGRWLADLLLGKMSN